MGRPVSAYFESFIAAESLDHYAESGYDALGTSSLNTPGFVNMTLKQPYGVVGAIIPWNVPVLFLVSSILAGLSINGLLRVFIRLAKVPRL